LRDSSVNDEEISPLASLTRSLLPEQELLVLGVLELVLDILVRLVGKLGAAVGPRLFDFPGVGHPDAITPKVTGFFILEVRVLLHLKRVV